MAGLNVAQIMDRARQLGRNISEQEANNILDRAWDQSQFGADEGTVMSLLKASGNNQKSTVPTAEDILASSMNKIKEQVSFLKDFMGNSPFSFDEALAREMATEKYKPYYTEILQDYVEPLQTKIARSEEDETTALTELTRQTGLGSTQIQRQVDQAISQSREGLAGNNLLFSGSGMRGVGEQEVVGQETLTDFMDTQSFKKNQLTTNAARERTDYADLISKRERDIFGTGREFDTKVTQDVEQQRGTSNKQYANKTLMAYTDRFGYPSNEATQYLNSYLNLN